MTPYRTAEAEQEPSMHLFNKRHSALRTVMTENIFGIWKRRFPCLNYLRYSHARARKVVIATAILHNILILWREEAADDDIIPTPRTEVPGEDYEIIGDDAEPAVIRAHGQIFRDQLRMNMPP
jgi:hypothetical protein